MEKILYLSDIAKIQRLYIEIFEALDENYPDYRVIRPKEKIIDKILKNISDNEEERRKIYEVIEKQSWNTEDNTFKPICDDLRELGYQIKEK